MKNQTPSFNQTKYEVDYSKKSDDAILAIQQMFATKLEAVHYKNGEPFKFYDLGSGLVTTAGANFLAGAFTGGICAQAINYHGSGTGTNAATVNDMQLQSPIINVARVAGTQTMAASPTATYQTVATLSYNDTNAVTEWGLFALSTWALSGVLWDRKVFSAINVNSGDSIQFTYKLSVSAGG
jgi:hypothetical protein